MRECTASFLRSPLQIAELVVAEAMVQVVYDWSDLWPVVGMDVAPSMTVLPFGGKRVAASRSCLFYGVFALAEILEEAIERVIVAPDDFYICSAIWAIAFKLSCTAILPIGVVEDGVKLQPENKVPFTLYPLV